VKRRWLVLIFGLVWLLAARLLPQASPPSAQATPAGDPAWHLRDRSRLPVGVSTCNGKRNARTAPILDREFSRLTSTEFYPYHLWTGPGQYQFEGTDRAVAQAERSGQALHGHCLLYQLESVCPKFLMNFPGSNEEFEALVRDFLSTTLTRYRGRVASYDLFNELYDHRGGKVRDSWLRRRFASDSELFDFAARCYAYAHEADPKALLFYNDYGQEHRTDFYAKGSTIAQQIRQWKRAGVPIHGYGIQFHTNIYRPQEDLEAALKLAVRTGLPVHISELDVSINWVDSDMVGHKAGAQGLSASTPELLQRQSETYRRIAQAYLRLVPPEQRFGITCWDLGDGDSWLAKQRFEEANLYDRDYQRKPAFYGFCQGLSSGP
jgi:endo-1,4-beta-xylanase